jgi:hypothetical protein
MKRGQYMNVGYEEKTFENWFNSELAINRAVYFPFGQVQEGIIGADAVVSQNEFYNMFEIMNIAVNSGVDISIISSIAEEYSRKQLVGILPSIVANVLFQYKKPEYLVRGAESRNWHQEPYYRYRIDIPTKQFDKLKNLSQNLIGKCHIIYAAPAVCNVTELQTIYAQHQLINNTNFALIENLIGHSKNTYQNGGAKSIAFSKPIEYSNFDFNAYLLETRKTKSSMKNDVQSYIVEFADALTSGYYSESEFDSALPNMKKEFEIRNRILEEVPQLTKSLINIFHITKKCGVHWGAILRS